VLQVCGVAVNRNATAFPLALVQEPLEAYDFHMTALGVSLLLIGAVVVMVEAHVPTLGVLGGPGVIALGVGAVLAVGGLGGGVALALLTALAVVAAGLGVLTVSLRKGLAVRRRRISTGAEGLIGHVGVVRSWAEPTGSVLVDGALWRARRSWFQDEQHELHAGDAVVVERLDGLTVSVRPAEEWELP
jgi:membrane-bound ClpP family serine protease